MGIKVDSWDWSTGSSVYVLKATLQAFKYIWNASGNHYCWDPIRNVSSSGLWETWSPFVWVLWVSIYVTTTKKSLFVKMLQEGFVLVGMASCLYIVWEGGFEFCFVFSLWQLFKSHPLPPWLDKTEAISSSSQLLDESKCLLRTGLRIRPPTSTAIFYLSKNC